MLRTGHEVATAQRDSVVVTVADTVREVTTVHIHTNDVGDTVSMSTVTDRVRWRDRNELRQVSDMVRMVRDTVYVERTDTAALIRDGPHGGDITATLRLVFWIIIALTGLYLIVVINK